MHLLENYHKEYNKFSKLNHFQLLEITKKNNVENLYQNLTENKDGSLEQTSKFLDLYEEYKYFRAKQKKLQEKSPQESLYLLDKFYRFLLVNLCLYKNPNE